MNWKYTDNTNTVAYRTHEGGSGESCVASLLPAGTVIESADPEPDNSRELRAAAYVAESDPLYFQEQRGEVPAGTWRAKVEEIRLRYLSQVQG